jgi:hypothetical protein
LGLKLGQTYARGHFNARIVAGVANDFTFDTTNRPNRLFQTVATVVAVTDFAKFKVSLLQPKQGKRVEDQLILTR